MSAIEKITISLPADGNGRRMGRRLPRKRHHRMNRLPDSPACSSHRLILAECRKPSKSQLGGEWRSLVAHLLWEQRVAGSNPVSPTNDFRGLDFPARHAGNQMATTWAPKGVDSGG